MSGAEISVSTPPTSSGVTSVALLKLIRIHDAVEQGVCGSASATTRIQEGGEGWGWARVGRGWGGGLASDAHFFYTVRARPRIDYNDVKKK